MTIAAGSIKVGCCGFRAAMADYVQRFPVVEVQQTFYQPPQISTLERWRATAPPAFEFTLKAWQLITHEARSPTYKRLKRELDETERAQCGAFRSTKIVKEAWATTLACALALRARRILFQCPASFKLTPENVTRMRRFFASIEPERNSNDLQFLWEPRGEWPQELVRTLCRELGLAHVVDPFKARTQTPEQCYFRLHGRKEKGFMHATEELEELLTMLPRESVSYVLFNNVRMLDDAIKFQELMSRDAS
ncbi:MAG: hypothetical protein QOF02_202 [Blastocatellia bacterium]|jgi:uncharacterized protein YecE (DUF72 family)|nr:hypothetical protein [Blastocatellia bacterium]